MHVRGLVQHPARGLALLPREELRPGHPHHLGRHVRADGQHRLRDRQGVHDRHGQEPDGGQERRQHQHQLHRPQRDDPDGRPHRGRAGAGCPGGQSVPAMDPANVAPMVAYLAHESCQVSGETYVAGGGRFARLFVGVTDGYLHPGLTGATIDDVAANWARDQRRDRLLRAERPDGLGRPLHVPPARVGAVTGILSGKTALVTGASSGIGRSTAAGPGRGGGAGGAGRPPGRAAARTWRPRSRPAAARRSCARPTSPTKREATRAVEDTVGHFGGLDILVNAAGMTQTGKVENGDLGRLAVRVRAQLLGRPLHRRGRRSRRSRHGGGDIVNISSTAGRRAVGADLRPLRGQQVRADRVQRVAAGGGDAWPASGSASSSRARPPPRSTSTSRTSRSASSPGTTWRRTARCSRRTSPPPSSSWSACRPG